MRAYLGVGPEGCSPGGGFCWIHNSVLNAQCREFVMNQLMCTSICSCLVPESSLLTSLKFGILEYGGCSCHFLHDNAVQR